MKLRLTLLLSILGWLTPLLSAQDSSTFALDAGNRYWIHPDVVYGVENGHENKLDVIYPHNATSPVPTVIYIHGGGWVFGDKSGAVLETSALSADGMGGGKCRVPHGRHVKGSRGSRGLPMRLALDRTQRQGLSYRS